MQRFLKYMVGGSIYFWVGYAVFALCYSGLHWSWFPAKIAADAIGWTLNYLVQRFWAFKDQIHLSEMQHAGRYIFIESIGFVLDYLIIWGLKSIGISPYIGFFISSAFFTVWSWLWYKYWVFPETGGKQGIMTHESIAKAILSNQKSHKPVLIGIEGYGGSGKTTFANQLKDTLGSAYVVNIDDFIVKEKIDEPSWDKGGFDRKRLEKQVLIPATTGKSIRYQELLWVTNTLSKPKVVPAVDYVIVEGISCYHPDIAQYYDFKVWVDTPLGIAKARGKARDAGNENEGKWDLWAEADIAYQQKYHPEQAADFIVSGV